MKSNKNLAIFMDHATAHIMEYSLNPMQSVVISSNFTHEDKENTLNKSENLMHNKEQTKQSIYYKKLSETILNYKQVLLFGPTEAKTELHNILKADHRYDDIHIKIGQTDKMTENQQHAYVKNYFSKLAE